MANVKKLPPALVNYWDKLTEADIAIINQAVVTSLQRDNPGALPFLKVETAVQCLDNMVKNYALRKRPFYRIMHKLESWRYKIPAVVTIIENEVMLRINPDVLKRRVPIARRERVNARKWRSCLPFAKNAWFTIEKISKSDHYYVTVAPKHLAGLMAWFEPGPRINPLH